MKRVVVAQRKGGVGKTTLAVSIAAEMRKRGAQVELVDADPQRSACYWAEPGGLHYPVRAITFSPQIPVAKWASAVRTVGGDYVVVDTPPSDEALAASIALGDLAVIPCLPSGLDLEATTRTLQIVNAVRVRRAAPLQAVLVPNRVDMRTLEGRQLVEEMEQYGETVGPPIGSRQAFVRAFSVGMSVSDFQPNGPADLELRMLCDLLQHCLDARTAQRRA